MPVEVTHNPWVWAFIATPILHIWLSRISKRYLIKGLAPALALLFARFAFEHAWTLRTAPAFASGTFDPKLDYLLFRNGWWTLVDNLTYLIPWMYPDAVLSIFQRVRKGKLQTSELHAA